MRAARSESNAARELSSALVRAAAALKEPYTIDFLLFGCDFAARRRLFFKAVAAFRGAREKSPRVDERGGTLPVLK